MMMMALSPLALLALLALLGSAAAKITQNRLYSDDMILESREAYDIRPFIAGFGDTPGEKVEVTFVGTTYPTVVLEDGTWEVQMNCCDYLTDQYLEVKGESNSFNYTNVACGQVFVCSGQSNMVRACPRHSVCPQSSWRPPLPSRAASPSPDQHGRWKESTTSIDTDVTFVASDRRSCR